MNKFVIGITAVVALASTVSAYSLFRENQTQKRQLTDYGDQVQQLLTHIEENTRQRLEFENRLDQLNKQLLLSENRVKVLGTEIEDTLTKIDPDYQQVESQIRSRVREEMRRQYQSDDMPTAASLIGQLSLLDNEERMAIMAVQGQYGNFLQSLDTTPERKAMITQALIDVTLGQDQAREDLLSQELPPREIRSQLATIMNPQTIRDELAYELNDAELALFDETLQPQRRFITRTAGENGANRIRGGRPNARQQGGSATGIIINSADGTSLVRDFIIEPATPANTPPR